jgi:hypothetical protein
VGTGSARRADNPVLSQHDWLQSLKGDPGPAGPKGAKGDTGAQGSQGPAGDITGATPTTICVVNGTGKNAAATLGTGAACTGLPSIVAYVPTSTS